MSVASRTAVLRHPTKTRGLTEKLSYVGYGDAHSLQTLPSFLKQYLQIHICTEAAFCWKMDAKGLIQLALRVT